MTLFFPVTRQDLAPSSSSWAVLAIIALAIDILHLPHQPIHPLPAIACSDPCEVRYRNRRTNREGATRRPARHWFGSIRRRRECWCVS